MGDERNYEQRFIAPPENIRLYEFEELHVLRAIAGNEMSLFISMLVLENPGVDHNSIFKGLHTLAKGRGDIKNLDTELDEARRESSAGISTNVVYNWLIHLNWSNVFDVTSSPGRRSHENNRYSVKEDQKGFLQGAIGILLDLSEKYGSLYSLLSRAGSWEGLGNRLNMLKLLATMSREYKEGFSVQYYPLRETLGQGGGMGGHLMELQQLDLLDFIRGVHFKLNEHNTPVYRGRKGSVQEALFKFFIQNRGRSFTIEQVQKAISPEDSEIPYSSISNTVHRLFEQQVVEHQHGISVTGNQAREIQEIVKAIDAILEPDKHKEILQAGRERYNRFIQNPLAVLDFFLKAVRNSSLDPKKAEYMINEINASRAAYIGKEIRNFLGKGGLLQYNEEEGVAVLALKDTEDYMQMVGRLDPAIRDLLQASPLVYRDVQGSRVVLNFSVGEGSVEAAVKDKRPLYSNPQYTEKFFKALRRYIENICCENNLAPDSISLDTILASFAS